MSRDNARAFARVAVLVVLCAPLVSHAELVRCTSKDGKSSVLRKNKCDSPDDIQTPATAAKPIPSAPAASGGGSETAVAMATYHAGDYAKALRIFEPLAQRGDATAQIMMSDAYHRGHGVAQDDKAAYAWARKAADKGDARAQTLVAAMMQDGMGVPKDETGALEWLEKAAMQNNAIAQMAFGMAYVQGRGVPKNEPMGLSWIRKSAEGGNRDAQALIGLAYGEGRPGWPRDEEKAVSWLQKAAAQGDANSRAMLKKMGR